MIGRIRPGETVRHIATLLLAILAFLAFSNPCFSEDGGYISGRETLERLVRLETRTDLKFDVMEQALVLAREQIQRDKDLATVTLNHRLEGMNEFQKRMDRLEGTFATKEELTVVQRYVWIGIGILLSVEILLKFVKRKNGV